MHQYGKEILKRDGAFELKLEPGVQRMGGQSFDDLRPAFLKLEDLMRVLGFSFTDIVAVQVAVREAGANGVRHGVQGEPARWVEFRYLVNQDEVVVEVEDDGPGFDPNLVPDPFHGDSCERFKRLGLFLMRAHMNWVHFNQRGNRVTLGRRRSAP